MRTEFFFSHILLRAFSIKTDIVIKKHGIFSETVKEKKSESRSEIKDRIKLEIK